MQQTTSPDWVQKLRGQFIVFDGPDGSGKSTQLRRFEAWLGEQGLPACVVREPGGTSIGEKIRSILLDPAHGEMDLRCEMLLYMASRAQLIHERIRPALARGEVVVADRFITSTIAYQGAAGGLAVNDILEVGRIAIDGCWPGTVVLFDVDPQTAAARMRGVSKRRKGAPAADPAPTLFDDRMEQKGSDFQRIVRQSYLDQARHDPQRHVVIDGSANEDAVFARVLETLGQRCARG